MLDLLTARDRDDFLAFCAPRFYGAVLYTRLLTYGCEGEARFWLSRDGDGAVCAAAGLSDGVLTVVAPPERRDECHALAAFLGAGVTEESLLEKNGARVMRAGAAVPSSGTERIDGENLKYVLPLLISVFSLDGEAVLYTDLSHKLRHGLIHGRAVFDGRRCLACAMTSGESPCLRVVSAVASDPEVRGRGYASAALRALQNDLDDRPLLLAAEASVQPFYLKLGWTFQ